jgi:hypothetical protein
MRKRRGFTAKTVATLVLALAGFGVAGVMSGVGLADLTTMTDSTSTGTTTEPPPTTTAPPPPPPPPPPPGDEGCTPGFWKQDQHFDSWTGFSPSDTLESVFDVPDSLGLDSTTLLQALNFGGGPGVQGGAEILLRAGVAALLNAASPDVDYPLTTAEVITAVNAALASGDRDTMLDLAAELDANNNLACPLD